MGSNNLLFAMLLWLIFMCIERNGRCYEPPGNAKFPLGDEEMNTDVLTSACGEQGSTEDLKSFQSSCTKRQPGDYQEQHLNCTQLTPKESEKDIPSDPLYTSTGQRPDPQLSCKRCDLQLSSDNTAVKVSCFDCIDLPATQNATKRDIVYIVTYLEVANYTSTS